jgi:tripartite-type tricarboxylate transporter receptor subunit TctC
MRNDVARDTLGGETLKNRQSTARWIVAGVLIGTTVAASAQQDFPNRPIRFITPYAPGGSTSYMARLIGQHYMERWGQNVIVDNRPGGNTIIGTETLAKSPPDGYTIMLATSTLSILSSLTKTPYDPIKDFAPIASIGYAPQVLVLFPGVPANTVQELVALAKAKPNSLNFGSSGAGGPTHLSGELFNLIAGVKTQHIPYKGAGPVMNDLLGGHVQMFFSVPVNILGHVKSGKLKAVAVTGPNRLLSLPQMPTFAEAGMPTFDVKTWNGVVAPAATPKAIVDKLAGEIGAMLQKPDTKAQLEKVGVTTEYRNPEQFAAMIRHDQAMYLKVIKANNIRVD